jgi:transcriptional regulator with GAF, ATPase, and Fis domain
VSSTNATVLITGETGTGKELLARAIHNMSPRKERPLVKVNCASLPSNLIESELFGHEKGAFTGAHRQKIGRFELAHGGTIFLDEIGELEIEVQTRLLRVLQEGEYERVGGTRTIKVDVRIIAATNRDLEKAIDEKRFRSDLYYRLNVFPIHSPPLRERIEDIPGLVTFFVHKYAPKMGKKIETIPQTTLEILQRYSWPGNIRELENIIERSLIISKNSKLILADCFERKNTNTEHQQIETLQAIERNHILKALDATRWRVSGNHGAAKILDINPKTLHSRMLKLGIKNKKSTADIIDKS